MPVNRIAMAGRSLLVLHEIYSDGDYLNYAQKICNKIIRHIKNNPSNVSKNFYIWDYSFNYKKTEDVSHGSIVNDFLIDCYNNNLNNIDKNDMEKLSNTFFNITDGDDVYVHLDGKGPRWDGNEGVKHTNIEDLSRWLPLNRFCKNNEIYDYVKKQYLKRYTLLNTGPIDFYNDNKELKTELYHVGAYIIQYYTNLIYYDNENNENDEKQN